MSRTAPLLRRKFVEWGVRLGLTTGAAWLGYGAVAHSLAYVIRGTATERAHMLASDDGRITALLSEKQSGAEATLADRTQADTLARTALQQDPTAVAAAATLGLNAQIRGETVAARRFFTYSQKLSRRDLRTRLWTIEDAVARGDVRGALRNYDIALRTSKVAPDLLFPVLASAIADSSIRINLARTLANRPSWGDSFIGYVAGNAPDPRPVVDLYVMLHHANVPFADWSRSGLIYRLVTDGHVDLAWSYYSSFTPGTDRRISRDPDFRGNIAHPSPFDWVVLEDSSITASIQRGENGNGIFDFATSSSVGGPLLRQLQLLPAGDYLIEGRSTGIEQVESARPYWTLQCSDGRTFGRFILPNSTQNNGRFSGNIRLPAGCPFQYLSLVARPSDIISGPTAQIHRVQLRPTR